MKIKWNGHASFTITATDGTVIVTDPYDPAGFDNALKYRTVSDKADGVLVSHDHADHNFVDGIPGSPVVLKGPGQVKGIQVRGIDTFHDESEGSERGSNVIFTFEIDGVKICFVGDLGHQLSEDQVRAIGPVDLLLPPVGGTFTVDGPGAVKLADTLQPKVIIPMHFKTDKCDLPIAGPEAFLESMENVKKTGSSEIEVSKESLPSGNTEVWVLDHAC